MARAARQSLPLRAQHGKALARRWGYTTDLLEPIAVAALSDVFGSCIVGADDSHLKILDKSRKHGVSRAHLWCFVGSGNTAFGPESVADGYTPSWDATEIIDWFSAIDGFIQCDGYAGYSREVEDDDGQTLVAVPPERRLGTRGQEVMNMTKRRTRYAVDLPKAVIDVLKWHVEQMLWTPQQQDSDLLFPSTTGGFRAPTALNAPFADIAEELGFLKFTQRGMRRTDNDLARAPGVLDLVTRSISGHATEAMQHHYSTVSPDEQRASIGKVIQLFGKGEPSSSAGGLVAPSAALVAP